MPAKRAAYHDKSEPVQNRLYRSLRVWSMYADLEESLGTFQVSAINLEFVHTHNGTPKCGYPEIRIPCIIRTLFSVPMQ